MNLDEQDTARRPLGSQAGWQQAGQLSRESCLMAGRKRVVVQQIVPVGGGWPESEGFAQVFHRSAKTFIL